MQNYLYSWLNIRRSRPARLETPQTLEDLQALLKKLKVENQPYNFVGSAHSYNGIQLVDGNVAIVFDGSGLKGIDYDYTTQEVTVEAGVTIEDLKVFLRPLGRQLLTSGNYMKQRVIGALMTGTHGYDRENAIMADSVTAVTLMNDNGDLIQITDEETLKFVRVSFGYLGVVVKMTLTTKPNEQFEVSQQILTLSQLPAKLAEVTEQPHTLAVFPYSDDQDPTLAFLSLKKLSRYVPPQEVSPATPLISTLTWVIIKLFWKLDMRLPLIRYFVQRLIGLVAAQVGGEIIITSPDDLDYLYDYNPMLESERNPSLAANLLSNTYTAYNIAVFVPKVQLVPLLQFIFKLAQEFIQQKPRRYLKNTFGCRYVGQSERCAMAGNYQVDSYSVDLFFEKTDLEFAELVQDRIAAEFSIRPHWGKTILKPYVLKHIEGDVIATFKQMRQEYARSGLLRPNLGQLESELSQ